MPRGTACGSLRLGGGSQTSDLCEYLPVSGPMEKKEEVGRAPYVSF